jgi:outer membrane protein assembly factor BamA
MTHSILLAALLSLPGAPPQQPQTRAAQIEQQRTQKAQNLEPEIPPKGERILVGIEQNPIFQALFESPTGFRLALGGLVTQGGFAMGPEYYRPDLLNGEMQFRIGARASFRRYQIYDALVRFPHIAKDRIFLELYAAHRNYPQINYYGPGPNSARTGRSNFRYEDTTYDATAALIPVRRLHVGLTAGYMQINVGPGTNNRLASTEKTYTPVQTPGIDRQSNFLRFGPTIRYDYRDRPGDPHKGGNYQVSYIYYDDRKVNTGNHKKFIGDIQQYIPFFNEKRVIALRGRTELSYRNPNQVIPFYLQPTVGGSDDLRGFRPFRFYDNNSLVLNAEYRWEIFTGFDMALFADRGKVFNRHAQLNFKGLEKSHGFGLRFSSRTAVVTRIDVGFSREGFQVWFKFGNVF